MLVYEKKVEDQRHLFGTLGNVPSDDDEQLIYKDAQGDEIEPVEGDQYFDDKKGGIVRKSDGKEVAVFIGDVCIIPKDFEPSPDEVDHLTITSAPTKTSYFEGQTLDLTGLAVEATMVDGDVKVITDYTTTPADGAELTTATTSVVISYGGKTVEQAIEVKAKELVSIAWSVAPTKVDYIEGQTLDLTGTVILAVYNDESESDVTGQCTFSPADGATLSTAGTVTVTATYEEKTATQDVTVTAKAITGIEWTTAPTKTTYVVGETLTFAGAVINAVYNDGSKVDVTSECSFAPAYDTPATLEMTKITATYQTTFSADQTIEVVAKAVTGLEWTTAPTKVAYVAGQTLDLTGGVVTASYNDGTSAVVTTECTFVPADGAELTTSVTGVVASFGGQSATQTITVTEE